MTDEKEKLYTLNIENVYDMLDVAQDDCEISRELLTTKEDVGLLTEKLIKD